MAKKINLIELSEPELIFRLLSERVGAVDPRQVFYARPIGSGKNAGKYVCMLGGKKLTANRASNLHAEAMMIESTELWKVFMETLAHEANMRMFKLAKNERDLDWGKAILHSLSVMEMIVKSIKNIAPEEIV